MVAMPRCEATVEADPDEFIRCQYSREHLRVLDDGGGRWDHGNRTKGIYWNGPDYPEPARRAMPDTNETDTARPLNQRIEELTGWWEESAAIEIKDMATKAVQYGSNSLAAMGRMLAAAQGREVDDDEALELGCYVYSYGKMQRWADAVLRGERPGADTIHDIHVYAKMAEKVRQTGNWP